jgi:hypothetical protein
MSPLRVITDEKSVNGRLQRLVDVDGGVDYEFGMKWKLETGKGVVATLLARENAPQLLFEFPAQSWELQPIRPDSHFCWEFRG